MTEKSFDSPNSLMQETIRLIKEDPRTVPELYAATGVPFHWLTRFVKGEFANPSVNRVQYLYEFLSGNKLTIR